MSEFWESQEPVLDDEDYDYDSYADCGVCPGTCIRDEVEEESEL